MRLDPSSQAGVQVLACLRSASSVDSHGHDKHAKPYHAALLQHEVMQFGCRRVPMHSLSKLRRNWQRTFPDQV